MKNLIEKQKTNGLELAKQFEVEELEERMEFGRWSAEASVEVSGGGTYSPNGPNNIGIGMEYSAGVSFTF